MEKYHKLKNKIKKIIFPTGKITASLAANSAKPLKAPAKAVAQYWENLGPGLTTGAADDDPSGIATYSQAGANFGLKFLWLAPFSFPLMAIVQEMCARIGMVTGRGLAGNIKKHYSQYVLLFTSSLLFFANTLNIGADLGAMAETTRLLSPNLNFYLLVVLFAGGSLLLQIFLPYHTYARYLKWLALVLLAYIFTGLSLKIVWSDVLRSSLIPQINFGCNELLLLCGVLGTTISPYLFFWQSSQEVEEEIEAGKTTLKDRARETAPKDVKKMRIDVWSGMFFSNLVMFFIILTCGIVLYGGGIRNIESASDAAEALRPLLGKYSYLMFTLGIIGTGLLAAPVLAGSAAYALAESFSWKQGLYLKFKKAGKFYGVIILSMALGALLNFFGFNPIKMLIYSAIFNGLVAPVVLILIVSISSNKNVMGQWVNNRLTTTLGWLICSLMILSGIAALFVLIVK